MADPKKTAEGTWRVQVKVAGQRDSGTFATKEEARGWASKRETEMREQKAGKIPTDKTLADAFDRYAKEVSPSKDGARWETVRLNAFKEHALGENFPRLSLGDVKLTDLDSRHMAAWRDERLKVVTGSTVNRDWNLLSNLFTIAQHEWKWLAASPTFRVRRPKENPHRVRRISEKEITRVCHALGYNRFDPSPLLKTVSSRIAVAWLFAIETGMRAGEIVKMTRAMVDEEQWCVHVPAGMTKGDYKRDVPLSKYAMQLLKQLPPVDEGKPLFNIKNASRDTLFRDACNMAGVEDLTFHDSKHEAISRLARVLEVTALAEMVAHKDLNMLMVYYKSQPKEIAERIHAQEAEAARRRISPAEMGELIRATEEEERTLRAA